jgi:putative PEP-CTERM system TPR-repeat lipoprotein
MNMNRTVISAIVASLIIIGCGTDDPETLLTSAKEYMAKNDNKAAEIQLKNALQANPNLAEARFLLGKTMLDSGNPASAEIELRKAVELKYPSDQVIPALARALLAQGKATTITDELPAIQLTTPESKASVQTIIGQAYLVAGKIEPARTAFAAAIAAVPDHGPAMVGQARIKAATHDLPGALTLVQAALEKSPGLYDAWQLKGDLQYALGDITGSSDAYRKALEIRPNYLPAHFSLISRSLETTSLDNAGIQLEAVKKIAPTHPQTAYLQALLYYRQKNFKAAQESMQQHLKLMPDSAFGLQLAGAIEYELKSYSTAETYLQKALPQTPELGLARRILIAAYLRSGQPTKALATLQPVLAKIEKDSNMLALAGEVFMQNGDVEKAGAYFVKSAALDPESKNKQTSVALSHLAQGDSETAHRELEDIASVDTGIKADLALIASQLGSRKFDQALTYIDELEKKQPENPIADNLRGTALLGKGDTDAARKSFEQALVKNPAYFPAAASLANMDFAEKKPEEARKRFENVLVADTKNVQALLALAELRARTGGKPDEVAELISKALTENPTESAPRLALIALYLSAGETSKAVSTAQDALAALPDRPEILDSAGRAQQAAGDINQALTTYGKLADLMPASPHPYLRMAEIQVAANNKTAALQSLRKALSIKDDSVEAQRGIMMLELDAGRGAEALAMARQVQKQRPKEAVGYVLEGDVYALKKSWPEAVAVYRNGIRQSGASELAIKLHAVLRVGNGVGEADKFAEGWLREHPKDLKFRLYLAEAATAHKDYLLASKQYKAILDFQPENAAMLNNLAWSLAQTKDPRALEYAEKAYKLAPEQPAIIDTLGGLLVAKGDIERGLQLQQKAVSLAPQSPLIRLNLAKALLKAQKKDEAKKELETLTALGDKFAEHAEVEKMLQGL